MKNVIIAAAVLKVLFVKVLIPVLKIALTISLFFVKFIVNLMFNVR